MVLTQLVAIGALTVVALGPGLGSMNREQQAGAKLKAYENVFTTQQKQDEPFKFQFPHNASTPKRDMQPRVICGMVTIPVTPDLDAKMVVARKADSKTESKIRVIEPQICNK
jgi:hypothetical protein